MECSPSADKINISFRLHYFYADAGVLVTSGPYAFVIPAVKNKKDVTGNCLHSLDKGKVSKG